MKSQEVNSKRKESLLVEVGRFQKTIYQLSYFTDEEVETPKSEWLSQGQQFGDKTGLEQGLLDS